MGAILSFLSGSAFRMVWGEISSWLNARQEHKHEVERLKIQGELDAKQHERNLQAQKQQAELGYKTIAVQSDATVRETEMGAWRELVVASTKPSGIRWVDAWNAAVRPAFATGAFALWVSYEFQHMAISGWVVSAFSMDLIAIVVGFFYADRSLLKRGK